MKWEKTITCELTCFRVQPAPDTGGLLAPQEWFAIATAHVYDTSPTTKTKVPMTPEALVISGAAMRTLEGRGSGTTELEAMAGALEVLRFQLDTFHKRDETSGTGDR